MTESQFIFQNKKEWEYLEQLLNQRAKDPKKLNRLFAKVSADLSYAQTHYPRRSVTLYLNELVTRVYDSMKTRPKYRFLQAVTHFFGVILPEQIIKNWKLFLVSLSIFLISFLVGSFSTLQDSEFPVTILGNDYVNVTEHNIESGDPMAIYKSGTRWGSFIGITLNNIKVAFLTFVLGILGSVGTYFILIKNGIMVGVFQTLFFTKGLLKTSMLTIWIHGTIEISSIIIAGAAGLILGNSILFPGSYSRMESLKKGAISSMYVLISTIPLFIIAGSFEGFVTPLTDLNNQVKLAIILGSVLFIVLIYVINPILYYRSGKYGLNENVHAFMTSEFIKVPKQKEEVLRGGLRYLVINLEFLFSKVLLPIMFIFSIVAYFALRISFEEYISVLPKLSLFHFQTGGFATGVILYVLGIYFYAVIYKIQNNQDLTFRKIYTTLINYFLPFSILSLVLIVPYYFVPGFYKIILIFILPPWIGNYTFKGLGEHGNPILALGDGIVEGYKKFGSFLVLSFSAIIIAILLYYTYDQMLGWLIQELLSWHDFLGSNIKKSIFINSIKEMLFGISIFIIIHFIFQSKLEHFIKEYTSPDLYEHLEWFGNKRKI